VAKEWSKQSRSRQKELVSHHKPWLKSSGPKSDEGKRRSSKNADKGKTPLREIQKTITRVHKERLELMRWVEGIAG